nr:MAG: hypothetical protein [Caudoviricetes sp.]
MLPTLDTPKYEIELPILKKTVKFRPFLVKEQKILLIAADSDDEKFLIDNIKQIIKNCCLTELDIESLSSVDLEFFFLQLRARSVEEVIQTKYRCENTLESGEICKNSMEVEINLLDINVETDTYNDNIKLTDNIGIKMKCPTIQMVENLNKTKKDDNIINKTFDVIIQCIDYIYDNENFYYPKEVSKKEITDFLESLSIDQFKKVEEFFSKIPKLRKELNVICSKCGFQHKIVLEGLQSFLD